MTSESKYTQEHTITYTEKRWAERLREFAPYVPREAPIFAATAASFWGIADILSQTGGQALSLRHLAVPVLATALSVALYQATRKYGAYVPEPLLSESERSRQIYRSAKFGWQFALARQMLQERTDSSDISLARIENGAHFSAPVHFDREEYIDWIRRRPEILIRLIRAVAVQCTSEMPRVLANTSDINFLLKLKASVLQLSNLYETAVEFELQSRSACPPEKFVPANEMTFGWSQPIRQGITEFLSVLDRLSDISPRDLKSKPNQLPSFSIEFNSPPNIDQFINEIQRSA